ncbi:MAG: DUF4293 domain-containing protein [Flavicella sp.]
MIQRVQSIYLLLAALISFASLFYATIEITGNETDVAIIETFKIDRFLIKSIGISVFISCLLSFVSIFLYKKRQNQFVMGRLNILINFYILGVLIIESLNLPGENLVSEKGIGVFIPIVVVVLLVMANKSIKKDEELVKSVDRLR